MSLGGTRYFSASIDSPVRLSVTSDPAPAPAPVGVWHPHSLAEIAAYISPNIAALKTFILLKNINNPTNNKIWTKFGPFIRSISFRIF
jgi:hypothetical protein